MSTAFEDELNLLYHALQNPGFRFILASHKPPSAYKLVRDALMEKYGRDRKIYEFSFLGKTASDIRDAVLRMERGILLLRNVEYLLRDEHADLCVYFNQRRDFFAKYDIAFVFFIEPGSFLAISKKLPDWWSLRALELEFEASSEAEVPIQAIWANDESSPLANWTQAERDQEIARLARLIADVNPDNLKLLGALYADLGEAYYFSHEYDQALNTYQKSLAIRQEIGDLKGEGEALNNIGQIYGAKGDYDTALRYLEQALAIGQQIGDSKGEGEALNNIGQIYIDKGDYDIALRYLEQSLAIRQQIGDRKGEASTLNNLAITAPTNEGYDTALRYLEQSLAIAQQIGYHRGEATTLNNIGQIYGAKGDYDTALRYLEQSLALEQQIGNSDGAAVTFTNMGAMLFKQERYEEAIPLLVQAHHIFQKIGSPNAPSVGSQLQLAIEQIGQAKFQKIIAQMG